MNSKAWMLLLFAIVAVSFTWMLQFMELQLSLPIEGAFWEHQPSGPRERADTFLPHVVLWPSAKVLLYILLLLITALLAARKVYLSNKAVSWIVGATIVLAVLNVVFLSGVFFGSGTLHYVQSLENVQKVSAEVQSVETPETVVRTKGDYPKRTFLVFREDFPYGKYLWISPQVSWEEEVAQLVPPAEVELQIGRDKTGLWVLLQISSQP